MPGKTISPAATLGARPALPFILESPLNLDEDRFIEKVLERLDSLQALATQSQIELKNLRDANAQILDILRHDQPRTVAKLSSASAESVMSGAAKLELRLLGPFRASVDSLPIMDWSGKKPRQLLAYLAMERGRMVPKDLLIEVFWPAAPFHRGANNLSIAVHQIRNSIAAVSPQTAQSLVVKQGLYGLDPARVNVDLWELKDNLDNARDALERRQSEEARACLLNATSLYGGELLASDPYEEWTLEPRRTLSNAYQRALAWLASEASNQKQWQRVLEFGTRMLEHDRYDEAAHRLLITAHWRIGNRSQAFQQYKLCTEILSSELGVDPSAETERLFEELRDLG